MQTGIFKSLRNNKAGFHDDLGLGQWVFCKQRQAYTPPSITNFYTINKHLAPSSTSAYS
jgi:hypothetical protein